MNEVSTVDDRQLEAVADAAAARETKGRALTVSEQINQVREAIEQMDFKAALPAHIPAERFRRVAMTAIQRNPDLVVKCSRRSLYLAFLNAAQDGLLPDGREGAVVPYKDQAQWLPMVAGIRKKVRNSGEVTTWDCYLVYEADRFECEFGLDPKIVHFPNLIENRGAIKCVYSVAVLKGGEKSFELMTIGEIEAIRKKASRSSKGPWFDYYGEMCRKTVIKRHAKALPMSTDLDRVLHRDDALYNFEGASDAAANGTRDARLGSRLDQLAIPAKATPAAEDDGGGEEDHDAETGEVVTQNSNPERQPTTAATDAPAAADEGEAAQPTAQSTQAADSSESQAAGATEKTIDTKTPPKTTPGYLAFARAWIAEYTDADAIETRWKEEKKIRNTIGVTAEDRDPVEAEMKARVKLLRAKA